MDEQPSLRRPRRTPASLTVSCSVCDVAEQVRTRRGFSAFEERHKPCGAAPVSLDADLDAVLDLPPY